jgi:hypothetical protein
MDVRYVQVLLGHENINSTQIYTHIERRTLQRKLKECHPCELARQRVKPYVEAGPSMARHGCAKERPNNIQERIKPHAVAA